MRSRAIFKAKTVICLTNIIMGALYALSFYRNRPLITFARLLELVQRLKKWRSKSALFRLQFFHVWFNMGISILLPVLAYKHATSAPIYGKA